MVRECFGVVDFPGRRLEFGRDVQTRFGDCVYDPGARELTRSGVAVPLSPLAFELLGVLLQARPRAVPQTELKQRLWPHSVVGRTSLARLVTEPDYGVYHLANRGVHSRYEMAQAISQPTSSRCPLIAMKPQASPTVSSMAAANASSGLLPPHSTN